MNAAAQLSDVESPQRSRARLLRVTALLPHEWFFGGFLLLQWLRLIWKTGPLDSDALVYLSCLVTGLALVAWCERHETRFRWYLRLWFCPVAMNVIFFTMHSAVLKVAPHPYDAVLRAGDEFLFGAILSVRAQAIINPVFTEVLSFCYLLFFPYLVISWLDYSWRGLEIFRRLIVGVFVIYGFGFLGYSLVPAAGPHLASPEQFSVPLEGSIVTSFNARVVAGGSNGVDVFPSLHCAISCFLLCFDRRHAPLRFRLLVVPCVGLWLATIYLRYHYFVDVVCGFALAAFAIWLTNRWVDTSPRALARDSLS